MKEKKLIVHYLMNGTPFAGRFDDDDHFARFKKFQESSRSNWDWRVKNVIEIQKQFWAEVETDPGLLAEAAKD